VIHGGRSSRRHRRARSDVRVDAKPASRRSAPPNFAWHAFGDLRVAAVIRARSSAPGGHDLLKLGILRLELDQIGD